MSKKKRNPLMGALAMLAAGIFGNTMEGNKRPYDEPLQKKPKTPKEIAEHIPKGVNRYYIGGDIIIARDIQNACRKYNNSHKGKAGFIPLRPEDFPTGTK